MATRSTPIDQVKHEVLIRIADAGAGRVVHWGPIPEDAKRLSPDVILASSRLLEKDNVTAIVTTILRALNASEPMIAEDPEPVLSIRERTAMRQPRERKPEPKPASKPTSPKPMARKQEPEPIEVADLMRQYLEHEEAMREIQSSIVTAFGGVLPDPDDDVEVEEEEEIEEVKPKRQYKKRAARSFSCSKCGAAKPHSSSKCQNCITRASEPVVEAEPDPEFEDEPVEEELY